MFDPGFDPRFDPRRMEDKRNILKDARDASEGIENHSLEVLALYTPDKNKGERFTKAGLRNFRIVAGLIAEGSIFQS